MCELAFLLSQRCRPKERGGMRLRYFLMDAAVFETTRPMAELI
jgi:hypothetical protein